jgi:hypothetical protein
MLLFTSWNISQHVRPPHFRDSAQDLVPHTPALNCMLMDMEELTWTFPHMWLCCRS